MPAPRHLLDANVLIRFIANDHPSQSPQARDLITRAANGELTLWLSHVCIAEIVWTLGSFYHAERAEIARWLKVILRSPGIEVEQRKILLAALDYFGSTNVDYIDAYHVAVAEADSIPIASFDKDFDRFKTVKRIAPR